MKKDAKTMVMIMTVSLVYLMVPESALAIRSISTGVADTVAWFADDIAGPILLAAIVGWAMVSGLRIINKPIEWTPMIALCFLCLVCFYAEEIVAAFGG